MDAGAQGREMMHRFIAKKGESCGEVSYTRPWIIGTTSLDNILPSACIIDACKKSLHPFVDMTWVLCLYLTDLITHTLSNQIISVIVIINGCCFFVRMPRYLISTFSSGLFPPSSASSLLGHPLSSLSRSAPSKMLPCSGRLSETLVIKGRAEKRSRRKRDAGIHKTDI